MEINYPFNTDTGWYNWGAAFVAQLDSETNPFGLPVSELNAAVSAYTAYAAAYDMAVAPNTRSTPTIRTTATASANMPTMLLVARRR